MSRRFGRSLGIDLIPHKACSYDCVYCQLGRTKATSLDREDFHPPGQILAELKGVLAAGPPPDVITLAGSGEPTLYRSLAEIVDGIKGLTDVPVLLLTGGALLYDPEVRRAIQRVDLLGPSLDAGDEDTWRRINRPPPGLSFDRMVDGIRAAARENEGRVRVEVMLVRDLNDSAASLDAIAALLGTIPLDGVDINSPVRPVPRTGVHPCARTTLERARELFGAGAEIIASTRSNGSGEGRREHKGLDAIVSILKRRPCTVEDLSAALGMHPHETSKALEVAVQDGTVSTEVREGEVFFTKSG